MVGVVTAASRTPKTIAVEVEYLVKHPKYGKYLRRRMKLKAHDEQQIAKMGDQVELMETRPISKTKTWRLVKVLVSKPQDVAVVG